MHARGAPLALGLLVAVLALAPRPAVAASEGTGLYVGPTALPWVENAVTIDAALGLARGEVRQTFWNNTGRPVEAVYVFPLPTGAVVTGMAMDVAGTRVEGVVAPRASALAGYERAIGAGRAAALTERERPGVYTQSVAGIPAGGTVRVTLRWQARLARHQGEWELAHPLVVGPRFTPGMATGAPAIGAGTSPDTPRAPDASRVTPPRDGGASVRFAVTATLHDAGAVTSPTHTLALDHGDDTVIASIDDPRGNRELVLRWRHASLGPVRAVAEATAAGTYVAVLVEPPPAAAPPRRAPRSWLLAIDRSASMQGVAEAQARRLAHAMVASLGPGDRIAVVAIGAAPRWSGADAASRAAVDRAIDRLPRTGGDLTAGLATTLARLPASPPTAVALVTDGLVADDAAAIARATAAKVTIHPVGVGAAPNRWLLEAIAAGTGGSAHVAIDPDDAELIAAELVAAADARPIEIDWRRPAITDAEPARPTVVPGGAALIVAIDPAAPAPKPGARTLGEVEVVLGGERLRAPIELVSGSELATEWARQRITRLEAAGQRAEAQRLALARGLVSSTTALLAVGPRTGDPVQSTVTVPLPLPAGQRADSMAGAAGDVFDLEGRSDVLDLPTGGADAGAPKPAPDRPAADKRPGKPKQDTTATTTAERDGVADEDDEGGATTDPRRELENADPDAAAGATDFSGDDRASATTGTTTTTGATGGVEASTGGERDTRAGGGGSGPGPRTRSTTVATAPPPPPTDGDAGRVYEARAGASDDAEVMSLDGRRAVARGRHGVTLSLGLGARLDERAPTGHLSLALDRRLARTRLFAGLRLDVLAAPSADRPLSAALLLSLARDLGSLFVLDAGVGPAYDGRAGLGYAAGLTWGRGPLGLGLRFSSAATAGPDPRSVTGALTVGF